MRSSVLKHRYLKFVRNFEKISKIVRIVNYDIFSNNHTKNLELINKLTSNLKKLLLNLAISYKSVSMLYSKSTLRVNIYSFIRPLKELHSCQTHD
jgi:hypothetical protein